MQKQTLIEWLKINYFHLLYPDQNAPIIIPNIPHKNAPIPEPKRANMAYKNAPIPENMPHKYQYPRICRINTNTREYAA